MAIWIDPPRWPAHDRLWSHLISESSLAELHAFAERTGIPSRCFEGDHYDVPQERYAALVAAGARPVEGTGLARMLRDSGLRFPKRKGERPLASYRDILPGLTVPHRLHVVASPLHTPDQLTAAAAVFVVDAAGSLLLVHSVVRDAWGAPAGGREPGESVVQTAVREVREETGLRLDPGRLHACGYERLTFDGEPPPGRWPHRRNYVACFTYALLEVDPAVAPWLEDVDLAQWVDREEAARRCRQEFWWPLMDHAVPGPG